MDFYILHCLVSCAQIMGCIVPMGFPLVCLVPLPWLWAIVFCDLWLPLPGLWAGFGLSILLPWV